ncbi:MAG: endonuclease III [bacterium]|nr:endonuclease III [bacterium]
MVPATTRANTGTRRQLVTWPDSRIQDLINRLESFRTTCRPTTLVEVQHATRSPFRILISCIISLRTKDAVTASSSQRLFELGSTPSEIADLDEHDIAEAIYPAGFYRNKARQIRTIGSLLRDNYTGEVPASEDELLALPGVGRKTANLVLGLGFGIPAICVDTHVHRISNRLGMVETPDPERTERALQAVLPQRHWININDLLVTFGQNQCHPTSPKCSTCPIGDLCPRVGVDRHR